MLRRVDPWFDFEEFRRVLEAARKRVASMGLSEIVEELRRFGVDARRVARHVEIVPPELENIARGWVYPSMLPAYRSCMRRLWIEVRRACDGRPLLRDRRGAEAMLVGFIVHEAWAREFAHGDTEVELVSIALKARGRADEVSRDTGFVVEVKTGFGYDRLAAAIQLGIYAVAAEEMSIVDSAVPRLVTPRGVFEPAIGRDIVVEYVSRVRAVIDSALRGEEPPPRLGVGARSRCSGCVYRSECLAMPSRGSVVSWLRERGFTVRRRFSTLDAYLSRTTIETL